MMKSMLNEENSSEVMDLGLEGAKSALGSAVPA
jgi:hypothetical protein